MNPIERIKAEVDLRELADLELNRSNQGKCPLHPATQKNTSFTYYPQGNSFYCFSCGKGGSVIDFWMHLNGRAGDSGWAIRDLAERAGIKLEAFTPEQEQRLNAERLVNEALAYAVNFYAKQLAQAAPILDYLVQERGFTMESIKEQRLGYANKQLLATIKGDAQGLDALGLTLDHFERAGLIAKDEATGRQYDFLRDRITFPIIKNGRVVHMSGREIPKSLGGKDTGRKYLNLPRPITNLFLEDNIRAQVVVFEGLPDTLIAHQWGLPATGQQGTNGMDRHARKFRLCKEAFLCFDTDGPGREGALKAGAAIHLEMAANSGQVKLIRLPEGVKDTNDFALAGNTVDDFRKLMAEARPLIDVMLEDVREDLGPAEKAQRVREVLRLLVPLDPIQQDAYFKRAKERLKLPISAIKDMFKQVAAEAGQAAPGADSGKPQVVIDFTAVRERVPAQDFAFNSPASGNFTTYVRVNRQLEDEDGRATTVNRWEPLMITATHENGEVRISADFCQDMSLSHAERKRIPFENAVRGRWRTEGKFPYSVERFVKGDVTVVDGVRLFDDMVTVLRRYIWLPNPVDHDIVACWVMMTYVHRLFSAVGYLHLHGVRESGKTNLATLIEELGFNAKRASSQTESVLFRSVEANCRTMIIDEAEKLNAPQPGTPAYQLMLMANDGYKKGASVEISEPDPLNKGAWAPSSFDIFSPKVFASIAELHYVLSSRCIVIPCLRATEAERETAGVKDWAQNLHRERHTFEDLRDRLHCWALLTFPKLHKLYTETLVEEPSLNHLRGREREMWMPLLVVGAYLDEARCQGDFSKLTSSVALRLVEAQKVKEKERRMAESDQAIEVVALTLVHDAIAGTQPTIAPARPNWGSGSLYVLKDLADLISAELRDMGLLGQDRSFSARRLVSLFMKTQAADSSDRTDVSIAGEKKRCIALNPERIKGVVERLGGRIGGES